MTLCALTLADTWRIDRLFLRYEDPARHADYRQANPDVRRFLEQQPGRFRLFPVPGYSFLKSARYHLDGAVVATGFGDFTLRRYDRLLKELEPVESLLRARHAEGREVPYTDAQLLGAARPLLDLVSARFLVTPRSVELRAERLPRGLRRRTTCASTPTRPPCRGSTWRPTPRSGPGSKEVLTALREGRFDLRRTVLLEEPPPIELPGSGADLGQRPRDRGANPAATARGSCVCASPPAGPACWWWATTSTPTGGPSSTAARPPSCAPTTSGRRSPWRPASTWWSCFTAPRPWPGPAPSAPSAPSWSWPGRAWPCGGGAGQRISGAPP